MGDGRYGLTARIVTQFGEPEQPCIPADKEGGIQHGWLAQAVGEDCPGGCEKVVEVHVSLISGGFQQRVRVWLHYCGQVRYADAQGDWDHTKLKYVTADGKRSETQRGLTDLLFAEAIKKCGVELNRELSIGDGGEIPAALMAIADAVALDECWTTDPDARPGNFVGFGFVGKESKV